MRIIRVVPLSCLALSCIFIPLSAGISPVMNGAATAAQDGGFYHLAADPNPPTSAVKLIFIHHSTGEAWLNDDIGRLGITLRNNNYFVSDTNYDWGPPDADTGDGRIGDHTDIGHWYNWFSGSHRDTYMGAVYQESDQHCDYSRLTTDPGGPNQIIMFKSCFPNSHLGGSPSDPVPAIQNNPLRGQDAGSEAHTVGNAKGIYIELLNYFATRRDKLFVVISAPPLLPMGTDSASADNARAFNNWLVNEWLSSYPHNNVFVFDFYNVLTSNGGSTRTNNPNLNDLGAADGNHHRWFGGAIQHLQTINNNYSAYGSSADDSHPTAAGGVKASGELAELLNIAYNRWKNGSGTCTLSCAATVPASALLNTRVSFSATATPVSCTGAVTWNWDFGDGSQHSYEQYPGHTYTATGTYTWTLVSTIGGITCTKTGSISITRGATPPPKATLLSPSGSISANTPTYQWNAVSDATYYQLWVNDSRTSGKIATWYTSTNAGCSSGIGTCSATPATTLTNGAAQWWIQTWNEAGYGPWSDPMNFSVGAAPGKATLIAPSGNISSTTPAYSWNAVSGASWYYLWVNDVSTGSGRIQKWYRAEEAGCPSGTGTCSVIPTTALAPGACTWWIQTWNEAGYGPWSDAMAFEVGNGGPPGKASLISPGGAIATPTPGYSWNAVSGATWYQLWVSNSAGTPVVQNWYTAAQAGCSSGSGTCSVNPGTTLTGGSYQWWIQTWNAYGYGPWSNGMAFTLSSQQNYVEIRVEERSGVARQNEYVSFGIPIPRAWNIKNANAFRLLDAAGNPVPAQFEALARWGGAPSDANAPVKWLLAGYFESISESGKKIVRLDPAGPGPSPPNPIQITTPTGKLHIDTGAAKFEMNISNGFNLLNQVTINNQQLLQPLNVKEAIAYQPAGNLGIVAGGNPDFTPRVLSCTVERSGALYTIVMIKGSILNASDQAILDFTARLHFFAGTPDVRVDFTVENNHPVIPGESDQPQNVHNQGAVNSVYIGDLGLNLKLKSTGSTLRVLTEQQIEITAPAAPVTVYQDSSGTDYWNKYVGMVGWPRLEASAEPRIQSYCTLPGYQITGGAALLAGRQALGWMSIFRANADDPQVTVCVRDYWQNFPKAISAAPDGTLSVNFFPNGQKFRHNFRVGEQKTHSILYHFGTGAITSQLASDLAKTFNNPLFGIARSPWYSSSGALGELPEVNENLWRLYEKYVRTAFEPNPDFDPTIDDPNFGNKTLIDAVQKYNFYGWQDYGDVPLDYEAFGPNQAGQMNLKYWFLYGMLAQFCRSSDLKWLDLARLSAWHLSDTDYLHIPDEGIRHWVHGAYFGHSQHDEPGNRNPNRNYNSPSVDLFFGVPDLLLAYYLTGERRFRDVALEGLEAMLNLSQFADFSSPLLSRDEGNLIFAYIEGYRQTGNARWLNSLKTIIGYLSDLSNKSWLTNPSTFGAANPGAYQRMFQFDQVVWTLGRYLDFIQEYGLQDDLNTKVALTRYADFAIDHAMVEYQTGRAAHRYDYVFGQPDATDLDINNWALVMADALSYAFKYSGDRKYLAAAAKFYATGTMDPVWQGDPPVYMSTKDLVNSCNWGLVYMNQSRLASVTGAVASGIK